MTITKADLERWAAYTGNGTMADLAHVGNLARECLTLTAKLTVAEQRISDLKFALGDGAGWFDRAMAAEQRAADLARRLAVVGGGRRPQHTRRSPSSAIRSVALLTRLTRMTRRKLARLSCGCKTK